jgi:hypothetical protein
LELNNKVPNEDDHTTFLAIDFGICEEEGAIVPKLIEVQDFLLCIITKHIYMRNKSISFLSELTPFFNGLSTQEYLKIIDEVNNHPKDNVILLEIEPKSKTQKLILTIVKDIGIPIICVTELIKKDRQLFYKNENNEEILVKRIYNRVIFDELVAY